MVGDAQPLRSCCPCWKLSLPGTGTMWWVWRRTERDKGSDGQVAILPHGWAGSRPVRKHGCFLSKVAPACVRQGPTASFV